MFVVQLEATRPGRAAALELVLDRAIPIVEKGTGQDVAIAELLRDGLSQALALRSKYPETIDLDRLVFTFATFTPDRQRALDVVMQPLGTRREDDIELYQSRARTALTLAIVLATPRAIQSARQAIKDIEPSWSPQIEANREAMLGDADALEATVGKNAELWASAEKHYESARTIHQEVRARVTNNLGWIALQRGDVERADALFRESGDDASSGRRWLAFLNALATPARANERLAGLRSLILANSGDGKPPTTLLIWLAATTTDPKEAADAAQKVLDDLADPFSKIKPAQGSLGFETEGAFQVGLGLASRKFYDLNTQAYASLWLMPPLPLDAKQLAAKLTKKK
jgi:Tfp pilus assembly protein PilF